MPEPTLTIRPLRDAGEARYCAGFMVSSDPWITLGITLDRLLERLTDPTREIHVATVGEEINGVLILFLDGVLKGYIQTIAVHPNWQSRGVGARLMEFAEERIFNLSPNVFLLVSSFNTEAQKFYKRLGYQCVGELANFVIQGHSEILMRKTRGPLHDFKPSK